MKIDLQFKKIYEIKPITNTKNYYLIYWCCFFIISFCIGLYTSCDYQSSIYVKGSCNTILLMAGQVYMMKSNENIFIYIMPIIDLMWDGRNGQYYNCYSNITDIKTTYFSDIMAETSFIGDFICNGVSWLTLTKINIDESPVWIKNVIIEDYNQMVNNFTGPFSVEYNIENKTKYVSSVTKSYYTIFNFDILEAISKYTNAINTLDVVVSYQCRSCYDKINSFNFQSFIRLIITMGSILSIGTFISNKIIPNFFKYENNVELIKLSQ